MIRRRERTPLMSKIMKRHFSPPPPNIKLIFFDNIGVATNKITIRSKSIQRNKPHFFSKSIFLSSARIIWHQSSGFLHAFSRLRVQFICFTRAPLARNRDFVCNRTVWFMIFFPNFYTDHEASNVRDRTKWIKGTDRISKMLSLAETKKKNYSKKNCTRLFEMNEMINNRTNSKGYVTGRDVRKRNRMKHVNGNQYSR